MGTMHTQAHHMHTQNDSVLHTRFSGRCQGVFFAFRICPGRAPLELERGRYGYNAYTSPHMHTQMTRCCIHKLTTCTPNDSVLHRRFSGRCQGVFFTFRICPGRAPLSLERGRYGYDAYKSCASVPAEDSGDFPY
jgi:hypothetical protein